MSKQRELFEGYRPLITHNRKRNTIPAEIWKGGPPWQGSPEERLENRPARRMPMAQEPTSAQGAFVRRDEAAAFRAKVEALIERFKPFAARTRERDRKWIR